MIKEEILNYFNIKVLPNTHRHCRISLKVLDNKFGFVNGDCLGFTLEHTELVLLNIGLLLIL